MFSKSAGTAWCNQKAASQAASRAIRFYSYLSESTGLAVAALMVW